MPDFRQKWLYWTFLNFWKICRNFEFWEKNSWVLRFFSLSFSFFHLEFLSERPKKKACTKLFYFRSQYKISHCPRERFYLTLIKGSTRIQVMELLYCCWIAVGFKSLHLSVLTWQKISKISSSAARKILLFWCFGKAT